MILDLIRRTPAFLGTAHSDAPDLKAHAQVGREAAAQGMVLLRNAGVLPLPASAKLALLGNTSYRMITGGTGSGDVHEAYSVSLLQGLKDAGLAVDGALAERYERHIADAEAKRPPSPRPFTPPTPIPEMAVPADEIARLSGEADVALLTIGRNSGRVPGPQARGRLRALRRREGACCRTWPPRSTPGRRSSSSC